MNDRIWRCLRIAHLFALLLVIMKGGETGMNLEIKRELVELAIGIAGLLTGFLMTLLHNYRKRLEEKTKESFHLTKRYEEKDKKIEEMRDKLTGFGGLFLKGITSI